MSKLRELLTCETREVLKWDLYIWGWFQRATKCVQWSLTSSWVLEPPPYRTLRSTMVVYIHRVKPDFLSRYSDHALNSRWYLEASALLPWIRVQMAELCTRSAVLKVGLENFTTRGSEHCSFHVAPQVWRRDRFSIEILHYIVEKLLKYYTLVIWNISDVNLYECLRNSSHIW